MNRSIAQSISRNLSAALQADDMVIAEAKQYMAFLSVMPDASPAVAKGLRKADKHLRGRRDARAVLQWKLKKYIAGNASYLTAADLQSLRSFLKESIHINEQYRKDVKAARGEFATWKEWKKQYDKVIDLMKQDERNQRALRQSIVREGVIARGRLVAGSAVKIIAEPMVGDENDHPEYKHTGYSSAMDFHMGKPGTVVAVRRWKKDGPELFLVQVAGMGHTFWWTKRQLLTLGVL